MTILKNLLIDFLGRRMDNFDWRTSQPLFDLSVGDKICILHHNDKIGDAILISLLVDALTETCPSVAIYVGASSKFVEYWASHPSVRQVIPFDIRKGSFLVRCLKARSAARPWRKRFDVVVSFHPFARAEQFSLVRSLSPRAAIGFGKDAYRLFDYSLEEHRHGVDPEMVALRTRAVMRVFGCHVDIARLCAHVPFSPYDEDKVRQSLTLSDEQGLRILVHAYGSGREKGLSPASVRQIVQEIRLAGHLGPIYVSVPEDSEAGYEAALGDRSFGAVSVRGPQDRLSSLFALVAAMDLVISPDTAVGHVAAAFGKPQVCLFARRGSVPVTWRPLNDRCVCVVPPSGTDVNGLDWTEFGNAVRLALRWTECPRDALRLGEESSL